MIVINIKIKMNLKQIINVMIVMNYYIIKYIKYFNLFK